MAVIRLAIRGYLQLQVSTLCPSIQAAAVLPEVQVERTVDACAVAPQREWMSPADLWVGVYALAYGLAIWKSEGSVG